MSRKNNYLKRMENIQGRILFFYERCVKQALKSNISFTQKKFYIQGVNVSQKELDCAVKSCPHLDGLKRCHIEISRGGGGNKGSIILEFEPDWLKKALGLNHHQYDEYMKTLKIKREQERWVKRIVNISEEAIKDETERDN